VSTQLQTLEGAASRAASVVQSDPLELLLATLCSYGVPTLIRMDRGWWCYVKMHSAKRGMEFRVESESSCATPTAAAVQCAQRIAEVLKEMTR
jgi:hypothetical protein